MHIEAAPQFSVSNNSTYKGCLMNKKCRMTHMPPPGAFCQKGFFYRRVIKMYKEPVNKEVHIIEVG